MQGSQNNSSGNMTASTSMYMPNKSNNYDPAVNIDPSMFPKQEPVYDASWNTEEYLGRGWKLKAEQEQQKRQAEKELQKTEAAKRSNFLGLGTTSAPSGYNPGMSDSEVNTPAGNDWINSHLNKKGIYIPEKRYGGGLRRAQEGMQQPSEEEMMMMQQAQQQQPQQEGGQDMMQQIGQALQQGVQPEQIIVQLIQQQVSPEEIMQIFVELGMPQEQVEGLILAITEKMQGSQQQMDPRQMQQAPMMMYGGYHPNRRLRRAQNGNFGNDEANAPMYNPTSMEDEIGFAPSKRVDWINTPDNRTVKSPENTVTAKLNRVSPWKDTFSGQRGAESILSGVKAITGAANIADYGRQSEVAADKMLPDAWSPTQTARNLGDIVGNTGVFRPNEKVGRRYQDNPFGQFYRRDGGQYATGKEYYMDGGEIDRLKELGYIVEYLD
jgi:hypothetical protein